MIDHDERMRLAAAEGDRLARQHNRRDTIKILSVIIGMLFLFALLGWLR